MIENYLKTIQDAMIGIPEKFRLEKGIINANIDAIIKTLDAKGNERQD